MDVLLCEDVPALGDAGAVVKVKTGYARNFLFPRGLATVPSELALKLIEHRRQQRTVQAAATAADAKQIAKRLSGYSITIEMQATKDGALYGSVGPREVVQALKKEGFRVAESAVELEPVKELGVYEVPLKLHAQAIAVVRLWVVEEK